MKKFWSNLTIVLFVLLASVIAYPWNQLAIPGVNTSVLSTYELVIKGGVGALAVIVSLVFMITNVFECKNEGKISKSSTIAAFLPLWSFVIAINVYVGLVAYQVYILDTAAQLPFYYVVGLAAVLVHLLVLGHVIVTGLEVRKAWARFVTYFFMLEIAGGIGGFAYFYLMNGLGNTYSGLATGSSYYVVAVMLGLYIIHLILFASLKNKPVVVNERPLNERKALEAEVEAMGVPEINNKKASKKALRNQEPELVPAPKKKSVIVDKDESILTSEQGVDPTEILYEEVSVDPELSRSSGSAHQVNSIDYYIEKPKMFKPLDPNFDTLVAYVRELPNVVTKLSEDKITFYVDRNPFLVLMNYGNYYRIAFKYELEKGIRLIIKYPTISKNKSTKDDLWFKANNYGDLPKEVIYQIVKTAYDNATN